MFPEYEQLKALIALIWETFPNPHRGGQWGAGTANALTYLLHNMRPSSGEFSPAALIRTQREYRERRDSEVNADDVVLEVLTFLRSGAGFGVPRYLRVVDTIQREVLSRASVPAGDLKPYAAAVEGLFLPAPLAALDEYGLPPEVAGRLRRQLMPAGGGSTLDDVLPRLKALSPQVLRGFDRRLLIEAQRDL